jgi:hypothetical protein
MASIDLLEPRAVALSTWWLNADGFRSRSIFFRLLAVMNALKLPPQGMFSSKRGAWSDARVRKFSAARVEKKDFGQIDSWLLIHQQPPRADWGDLWLSQAYFSHMIEGGSTRYGFFAFVPSACGMTEDQAEAMLLELARDCVDVYGHISWSPRDWGIGGKRHDLSESDLPEPGAGNLYHRCYPQFAQAGMNLLDDVRPVNFLSERFLSASPGQISLRRWIGEKPRERGTIVALNERISVWRPPVERIPVLREQLYRLGRLYYSGFFVQRDTDPPGLWPRDFAKPFVPTDPIPRIFQADFYTGRDPKLSY